MVVPVFALDHDATGRLLPYGEALRNVKVHQENDDLASIEMQTTQIDDLQRVALNEWIGKPNRDTTCKPERSSERIRCTMPRYWISLPSSTRFSPKWVAIITCKLKLSTRSADRPAELLFLEVFVAELRTFQDVTCHGRCRYVYGKRFQWPIVGMDQRRRSPESSYSEKPIKSRTASHAIPDNGIQSMHKIRAVRTNVVE